MPDYKNLDFRKVVALDFDGVIHSYSTPWVADHIIPDPPVEGIDIALKELTKEGYTLMIFSSRARSAKAVRAMREWLRKYNLSQYIFDICYEKPVAVAYVDDRAIYFDGNPSSILPAVKALVPWHKDKDSATTI